MKVKASTVLFVGLHLTRQAKRREAKRREEKGTFSPCKRREGFFKVIVEKNIVSTLKSRTLKFTSLISFNFKTFFFHVSFVGSSVYQGGATGVTPPSTDTRKIEQGNLYPNS